LGQRLRECREPRFSFPIARGEIHEHTEPPHLLLLRARRERPADGWASNYFDEIASSHCLPRA
jgi:hypothetical protein